MHSGTPVLVLTMVACTVTGAAVKKNCAAASTLGRDHSVICTSTVTCVLILPHLGHFNTKSNWREPSEFEGSFFLFSFTDLIVRTESLIFSCENSFGFYRHSRHHLARAVQQTCLKALVLSSSSLLSRCWLQVCSVR